MNEDQILDQQLEQIVKELTAATFPKSTKDVMNLLMNKGIYSESECNNLGNVWDSLRSIQGDNEAFQRELHSRLGKLCGPRAKKIYFAVKLKHKF